VSRHDLHTRAADRAHGDVLTAISDEMVALLKAQSWVLAPIADAGRGPI
jgi:hypothetical protein